MNLQSEGSVAPLKNVMVRDIFPIVPGRQASEAGAISPFLFESLDVAKKAGSSDVSPVASVSAVDSLREEIEELKSELQRQAVEALGEIEKAKNVGKREAEAECELELDRHLAEEHDMVQKVCEQFHDERERYFASVEGEVVRLSLAIAQRILHRELMIDPVMLTAVARVALEKVKDESGVALRVPALDEALWRQSLAAVSPELILVADERMSPGDCVIETQVGRVELGVAAQLHEIERGFVDLLQRRPA